MPSPSSVLPLFEPVDAAVADKRFLNKYFFHNDIAILQRDETVLISGEKGAGKTAFCKFLEASPDYSVHCKITLDHLNHVDVAGYISELSGLSGVGTLRICAAFWRCVILISAMQAAFNKDKSNFTLTETRIVNFLRKTGHLDSSPVSVFLQLVESLWSVYSKLTNPASDLPGIIGNLLPSGQSGAKVDKEHVNHLRDYPFSDPDYLEAENLFGEYLQRNNHRILVCLDGFDTLRSEAREDGKSIDMIFRSLVAACYDLQLKEEFTGHLIVKALIPHDRWITLRPRDLDKLPGFHYPIQWKYENVKEFVRRRLCLHPELSAYTDFNRTWYACFPSQVTNACYGIKENTFDYILRHTQYRPRQIQHHIRVICQHFHHGNKIDADAIPGIIATSCERRSAEFVTEHQLDYPKLGELMNRFRGVENVLPHDEFRSVVAKIMRQMNDDTDLATAIQRLYSIGFIGTVRFLEKYQVESRKGTTYIPPWRYKGKNYKCEFYYDGNDVSWNKTFNDDDLIVIHPMFHDRCACNAHEHILVG